MFIRVDRLCDTVVCQIRDHSNKMFAALAHNCMHQKPSGSKFLSSTSVTMASTDNLALVRVSLLYPGMYHITWNTGQAIVAVVLMK